MTLRAALLAMALYLATSPSAGATSLSSIWKPMPMDWGIDRCLSQASQVLRQAGFVNIRSSDVSAFGDRNVYLAQLRCIPEKNMVFFVTAGPDVNASVLLRDQLAAAFSASLSVPSSNPPAVMRGGSGIPRPPAPQRELMGAIPGPGYFWIGGHWRWNSQDQQFTWMAGQWEVQRPGYRWEQNQWTEGVDGWVYLPGHWVPLGG